MPERRKGTVKKNVRFVQETLDEVEAWAAQNGTSFSAALDSLVRTGLGQARDQALAPVVASVVKREISQHYDRLIRLLLYNIVESGTAYRLAAATLYKLEDDKERYDRIKAHAIKDTRVTLGRAKIGAIIEELFGGDREGKLPGAGRGPGGAGDGA